jgi:hypothetical protein
MKNILFTILATVVLCSSISAQKIEVKNSWGTNICSMDGKKLKMSELVDLMKENTNSFELVNKAKKNYTVSSIFGAAGGALVGWPIGSSLGGGDPNWSLAGIGAGLIAISIPFNNKYNKNIKNAVENYNTNLESNSYSKFQPKLKLKSTFNGIGIALLF